MNKKIRAVGYSTVSVALLAGLAATAYNNWLLGPFINNNLFKHDGSISEYSVASQPSHWLFQGLDIFSGVLLIIIGYLFWNQLKRTFGGRFLAIGTMVMGVANILDALASLPCSETLNKNCVIAVNLSPAHFQMPPHAYSSTLIGICYLVLPASALIYSYRQKLRPFMIISGIAVLDAMYSLVSALAHYDRAGSITVQTSGSSQEIQMLIMGLWIIAACLSVLVKNRRPLEKT